MINKGEIENIKLSELGAKIKEKLRKEEELITGEADRNKPLQTNAFSKEDQELMDQLDESLQNMLMNIDPDLLKQLFQYKEPLLEY